MISIELHDVQLHAYHGIYEGEKKTGNNYEVNLRVNYNEESVSFEDLKSTINYEELFAIVKQRMQIATPLLEKVCEGIIRKIKHQYPFITEAYISIYKLQTPIENFQGKAGVSMYKTFNG